MYCGAGLRLRLEGLSYVQSDEASKQVNRDSMREERRKRIQRQM